MAVFWAFNPSILADAETTNFRRLYPSQVSGNGTISTVGGEKCISSPTKWIGNTDITTWPASSWSSGWAVFRWRKTSLDNDRYLFGAWNHASVAFEAFSIIANTSGTFDIRGGNNASIATGQGAYSIDTWYTVAVQWVCDNTAGEIHVWLDGSSIYSATGLDTTESGTNIARIIMSDNDGDSLLGWCILGDTTGTIAAAFDPLETYNVAVLYPNGAGNSTQFTPSAGDNYDTVNEEEYSATDYNNSNTDTHKDTFAMDDLPASGVDEVLAVVPWATAEMDDATARQLNTVVRHSTSEDAGNDRSLVNGQIRQIHDCMELNPSTAAQWAESEVNAMEVGYELSI